LTTSSQLIISPPMTPKHEADGTEEVPGPRAEAQEEERRQQIQQHPKGPRDAVLGLAELRARWVTTVSPMRSGAVTPATQTGMNRCISPNSRTSLMTSAR
jgi:hypothetical protein